MWLLPSLDRPANLARLFAGYRATGAWSPGMVLVDKADWERNRAAYEALDLPAGWMFRRTDGVTQGDKIREVWAEVRDCPWLGLIGDDCVPATRGWDRALVDGLDKALIVSCDDGWQAPRRLANCWVMRGDLIRATSWIFPPGLHHLFVDDLWETIGRELRCWQCLMQVRVAHRHVMTGQVPADATHRAAYGNGFTAAHPGPDHDSGLWHNDEAVFAAWKRDGWPRLRGLLAPLAAGLRRAAEPKPEADPRNAELLARARARSVMICTPMHRAPSHRYMASLLRTVVMLERLGIRHEDQFMIGNSNLPKARNELANHFLKSEMTDLVFVDADMGWREQDFLRLLASQQPVVGGVGRKKSPNPDSDPSVWCFHPLPDAAQGLRQDDMGAIEVLALGTGFLKVSREAFATIAAARPERERRRYYRYFAHGDEDEGEDYEFCRLWRDCGGKVWLDPHISLTHSGEVDFWGRVSDLFVAAEPLQEAADD